MARVSSITLAKTLPFAHGPLSGFHSSIGRALYAFIVQDNVDILTAGEGYVQRSFVITMERVECTSMYQNVSFIPVKSRSLVRGSLTKPPFIAGVLSVMTALDTIGQKRMLVHIVLQ